MNAPQEESNPTQVEYFKEIVATIREPLLVLDASLRVLAANRSFYKFFKVKAGETIGLLIYDLGNRQWDIPGLRLLLETILPQKVVFNEFNVEHDFPTIGRRILLLNARRISRPSNKAMWILLAFEDVTERRRLERGLEASEERFRQAFETAQDGMLLIDKTGGQVVNSNESAQDSLGYSKQSLQKKNLWELGILKDEQQFRQTVLELEEQGSVGLPDMTIPTKRGGHFPADVLLTDRAAVIQCNIRDISERKRADEALQALEGKYRTIFENAMEGLFQSTPEGHFLTLNPAFARMLGYESPEEMIATITDIGRQVYVESLRRAEFMQLMAEPGSVSGFEFQMHRKDGGTIWVSENARAIRDANDTLLYYEGTTEDITERKLAEETLQRSQQDTIHANQQLLTLGQAAQAVQSVRTQEEVYAAIQEQMTQLGYNATVFELADEGKDLRIVYLNYASNLVHRAEKMTGLSMHDYRFHPRQGSIYQRVLKQGETVHVEDAAQAVAETLPRRLHLLAQPAVELLHLQPTTFAPLLMGNETIGIFSVTGLDLTEADNLAITAFARQAAIAIQNARLYEQAQQEITERKHAEEALRESEHMVSEALEFNRKILNTSSIGILTYNESGQCVSANTAAAKITGGTLAQLLAQNFHEIPSWKKSGMYQAAIRALDTGIEQLLEVHFVTTFGKDGWLSFSFTPFDSAGERHLLVFASDITKGKEAEQALVESENKFRWLYEYAPVAYHILNPEGTLTDVNHRWCELLGYPREEVLGKVIFDFVVEQEREAAKNSFEKKKQSKQSFVEGSERNFRTKDGAVRTVKTYDFFSLDERQNITSVQTTIEDITERKQAEEKLSASENELRALFAAMTDVVIVLDADGRYLKIAPTNPINLYRLPEDMLGKTVHEVLPKEQADFIIAKIGEAIQTKKTVLGEYAMQIDSKEIWFESSASRLSENSVIWVAHDFTERKRAEEKIQQLNAELEQRVEERTRELHQAQDELVRKEKLAVLGQLAGGVGHELRNPLGVISNSVYYLKMVQPEVGEKIKQHHAMIEQEVHNAARIVSDLLDYARVISTDRKAGSVSEMVQHTLSRFPVPTSIRVSLKIPADLPQVYADSLHVEQILGNLITNGCQAMKDGSKLTISVREVVPVSALARQKQMVTIAVKDTGTGITPENMKKLFEPLFSTKAKGIGLGLSVSKKLAEANGGQIEVKSEAGKGSTFTLYLPVVSPELVIE